MGAGRKILISADDPFHADMLSHIFGVEGFLVLTCGNDEVYFVARDERPDAVISVVGTLGASISDLAMQLRAHPGTKSCVLLGLYGHSDESGRLRALEAGADEVLAKSCSMTELLHRLRVLWRRLGEGDDGNEVRAGDIVLNVSSRSVKRGPRSITLAPLETKLLQFLMNNRDRLISRQELMDRVWGQTTLVDARTVDVAVNRLRRNLNTSGEIDPIRTVHGEGYAFGVAKLARTKTKGILARGVEKASLSYAALEYSPYLFDAIEVMGGPLGMV